MRTTAPHAAAHARGVWPARVAAVVLALLGLPLPAWLPGGLEIPTLDVQLRDWGTGSLLTLGIGALAWMLSRRHHWPLDVLARGGAARGAGPAAGPMAGPAVGMHAEGLSPRLYLVALCALLLYALVATTVFSRRPLLIDEVVQLWQAQRFAEGRLWIPAPTYGEFFSFLHLVDVGERVYAQFPPGGPFMLWLGLLAGAPWLVGPVCGALSVLLFARLARAVEPAASDRWVLGATLLFALTPFGVFMFGSYMNHVTALLWILVAVVSLVTLVRAGPAADSIADPEQIALHRVAMLPALVLGLGLGAAATIRPLDAFAFALPAAIWLVVRAGRSPQRWMENVIAGIGVAVPFMAMMYVNAQTTGHPLKFGYEVLWGTSHGLGFHAAPWGEPHTPLRGLALASLYQWRLQTYLFETPFPSLVLPVVSLWCARRLSAIDRYLLASSALVILAYLLYWHDGFYLGPRFVVPLLPALVLWTARLPLFVRERVASLHLRRGIAAMLVFGVVGALVFNLPVRIALYRAGLTSMRVDYARAAERSAVRNALVFVRESWGAQLVARLWALGVSRPMTESVYRGTDSCNLEQEISALERDAVRGARAEQRLAVLLARDSAFVVKSMLTPDPTERVRPGIRYTATCLRRIEEDRAGFLHYVPLRLITTGGNIYARDLHARDSLLLAEFPDRPVFLLTRTGTRVDDPTVFLPLRRDSLAAAWRVGR
ncbi:MAG: hypothetical protein Q8K82_12235 [Gemmatimonadaceae bacterium]|nr:hypothetical protein [Gemmatimonadaceae bacterium]